jgi:EAL domain-containing protein (putative c-di-GMP-specific phosphodiesterase class I)
MTSRRCGSCSPPPYVVPTSHASGVDRDALRQAMVAGLVYFASATGCRLIAEGVETRAEALTLERLGFELAQGYLDGCPALADSW